MWNFVSDWASRILTVKHHKVSGFAPLHAIVIAPHQVRGAGGDHLEARVDVVPFAHLADIGVEVGHAEQRTVAERREGIEYVVGGERAVDTIVEQLVGRHHPTQHVVILVSPHEVQVSGGQHGEGNASIGHAPGYVTNTVFGERGELRHVPHSNPAAIVVLLRLLTHILDVHGFRRVAKVEVHVDVDVKSPRHLEDAVDLPVGIGVGVGRCTHHTCAALQGFYHEFVSPGIVQKTLLGKDTDLDVHGPLVRLNEGQDTLQAPQPDTRVDFEVGAQEGGTVQDAFFQGARGAGADVGSGELLLDGCHLCNRFVEVPFL